MAIELAYVIITPYSLYKSRTGGILARLISRTGLDLVAARMFGPSPQLVREYADIVVSASDQYERQIQEAIRLYIQENFGPDPKTGRRRRVMVLLFRGEDAVRKVRSVVGHINPGRRGGETIRDTYGDFIIDADGQLRYFEPAVLAAPDTHEAEAKLRLWAHYSDTDAGLLEDVVNYAPGETGERTLVLIKPDNFLFPTGRPGNVIDFFSRTGLFIVAIKVHRMSTDEAVEFYGPVREILRNRFSDVVAARSAAVIETEFGFKVPDPVKQQLGQLLGPIAGEQQFENIVRFMSGRSPAECDAVTSEQPGTQKCIALVYEGVNAVQKIRDVLGPTDPSKAPPGSIRREFGSTVMVNAAHASDSVQNAQREMAIVRLGRENLFRKEVEDYFGQL
jgi:nucleoside diphosphate kinase